MNETRCLNSAQLTTIRNSSRGSTTTTNNISTTKFRSFGFSFASTRFCFVSFRSFIRSVVLPYKNNSFFRSECDNSPTLTESEQQPTVHTAAAAATAAARNNKTRRKGMKEETAKKRVFMLCDRFINVCTRLVRAALLCGGK